MFSDARQEVADALSAAGLLVTLNPAAVPPMVLVGLPEAIVPVANSRSAWEAVIPVWIVANPPGNAEAASWLLDELPLVLNALAFSEAEPDSYEVAGKECPAYRVEYTATILNELRTC